MNPLMQMLAAQGLVPMPPKRPQGLGVDWGMGVPEHSQAPIPEQVPNGFGNFQFPSTIPFDITSLMQQPQLTPRGQNLGLHMSGITPPQAPAAPKPAGKFQLSPQDLLALMSSEVLR
jgi:hypothetical protein